MHVRIHPGQDERLPEPLRPTHSDLKHDKSSKGFTVARIGSSKRTLAVLSALVLASVATVALWSYVRGVEAQAVQGADDVEAFVAKDVIRAGTSGRDAIAQGLITKSPVPRRNLAEGAIAALDHIQDKVADVDIMKGEQILTARFVAAQDASALPIPPEMQAVSVEVGIPPGVAGFIQKGSRVSIVTHVASTGQGGNEPRVQYLLQDVQVLNVGQRVVSTPQQGATNGQAQASDTSKVLLTLALPPKDVEKLTFAIWNGQLYFTLLPPDQKPVGTTGRTSANIFQP